MTDLDRSWPGGSAARATLGALGVGGRGEASLGDGSAQASAISFGTCEGLRDDGRAYVLLDGASAALALQVDAALPARLLVGRRVVVLGDDPATWLVVGVFGASLLNVPDGLAQLDAGGDIADGLLSSNVALLSLAQTFGALKAFAAGATFGYTSATDVRIGSFYIPRLRDLTETVMHDFLDEFALLTSEPGRLATLLPAPSAGSGSNLFLDDNSTVSYSAGTSPFPITLEVDCSANPLTAKANATWRLGLTIRPTPIAYVPATYTLELWDDTAAAYTTVVSAAALTFTNGVALLPQFASLAGSGLNISKLKLTLDGTNPLPAGTTFRIQRVILYHASQAWDPWHLHRLGGTVRGTVAIGAGGPATPTSVLQVVGPIATAVAAKTAAYTLTATDSVVTADATGGAFTLLLPTAVGITGRQYTIKRLNAGANTVTVDANGAQTIDVALTYVLTVQFQTVRVVSDGANWIVV